MQPWPWQLCQHLLHRQCPTAVVLHHRLLHPHFADGRGGLQITEDSSATSTLLGTSCLARSFHDMKPLLLRDPEWSRTSCICLHHSVPKVPGYFQGFRCLSLVRLDSFRLGLGRAGKIRAFCSCSEGVSATHPATCRGRQGAHGAPVTTTQEISHSFKPP